MTATAPSRLVLLHATRNVGPQPAKIRRYRLARARLQAQRPGLAASTRATGDRLHP